MAKRSWGECFSDLFRRSVPTCVQTAQRYLELARECMEHVQSISTSLQFNHGQCEHLAVQLKLAVQSAEDFAQSNSSGFNLECVEIMKLLWRSAKEVESFTQDCCKENWIKAAILFADKSEFVSLLCSEFDLCTFLLQSTTQATTQWDRSCWKKYHDALRTHASQVVKEEVSRDHSNLLTRLETVILSDASDEDCQLAKCLSGRLRQPLSGLVQWSIWDIEPSSLRRVQRLGSGSAGMVHKSQWLTGEVEVAEKVFYGSDHPSFKNEVEVLAGLAHPNIVPLLGYTMDEDKCSIVMELMDEDLLSHMEARLREDTTRKFPFTDFEAVDMMLQTGEGMLYLHGNKVVHRDLKSQNILVKRRKDIDAEFAYVKVADFGLATTKENSITHSNQTPNTGTPRWMAPELIIMGADDLLAKDQELRYPFKVDIYSFGMVCYEILTGKVPFSTTCSPKEVKKMVLSGERPILPSKCPVTLDTLIRSCWEPEANLRPSFVEICKTLRSLRSILLTGHEIREERKKSRNMFTNIIGISLEPSMFENMSERVLAISYRPSRGSLPCSPSSSRIRSRFKGVRQREGVHGYLVEIRPPKWKRTIWLGTYNTDREAAGAYDAGIFYTNRRTKYNFPILEKTFPPLPSQLCLDNPSDSDEVKTFIQKEARTSALMVKSLTEIHERVLQKAASLTY